jgi:hypothetical protein
MVRERVGEAYGGEQEGAEGDAEAAQEAQETRER